jgi:DNA polymerase-3 subunit epsilon
MDQPKPHAPGQNWEDVIAELEATGDYRVLRKFYPRSQYAPADGSPARHALAIDVETTGLDTAKDRIIEFAAVPFTYSADTGRIFEVAAPIVYLEDPGRAIPAEITGITGITDAMVAGQRIDEAVVAQAAGEAQLVIAHNAAFDRKFVQRRLPIFQKMPWACSLREVPWRAHGHGAASLESLMIGHCRAFFSGHRATDDCLALIHLLATPLRSGDLPFKLLLESARKKTARIWALNSAFETKDMLKARAYRWNGGDNSKPKAWYIEVTEEAQEAEVTWLAENVYRGQKNKAKVDILDACSRYAD